VADHKRATIIGSGVNGLTTAIVLQEAGWDVAIWTAASPEHTTSTVAAAIWYPYKAYPEQAVLRWGTSAFTTFAELANEPGSGVIMRDGVEIWRHPVADPWWRSAVPGFGRCAAADLPSGYQDGYAFRVPVIDMPIYLGYLRERFTSAGGTIEMRRLRVLAEVQATGTVVINCTGLGARELAEDTSLVPIRGQVVWVTNPGIERFMLDETDPRKSTYIVPRINDCVLGGTADEGAWDTTPDPAVAEDILRRCSAIEPRLSQAHIIGHRVGLRPARPAIRLERETRPDGSVYIHNYGHGGAGVTLSWGCAYDVAQLAENAHN
jgi:D-amino-acid oxidase